MKALFFRVGILIALVWVIMDNEKAARLRQEIKDEHLRAVESVGFKDRAGFVYKSFSHCASFNARHADRCLRGESISEVDSFAP